MCTRIHSLDNLSTFREEVPPQLAAEIKTFWRDWLTILMQNCSGSRDSIKQIHSLAAIASTYPYPLPEVEKVVCIVKELAAAQREIYHPELKAYAKKAYKNLTI